MSDNNDNNNDLPIEATTGQAVISNDDSSFGASPADETSFTEQPTTINNAASANTAQEAEIARLTAIVADSDNRLAEAQRQIGAYQERSALAASSRRLARFNAGESAAFTPSPPTPIAAGFDQTSFLIPGLAATADNTFERDVVRWEVGAGLTGFDLLTSPPMAAPPPRRTEPLQNPAESPAPPAPLDPPLPQPAVDAPVDASAAAAAVERQQDEERKQLLRDELALRDRLQLELNARLREELYAELYAEIFDLLERQLGAEYDKKLADFKRTWASNHHRDLSAEDDARRADLWASMGPVARAVSQGEFYQSNEERKRLLDVSTDPFKIQGAVTTEPRRDSIMTSKAKEAAGHTLRRASEDRQTVYTARIMKHPFTLGVDYLDLYHIQDLLSKGIMFAAQTGNSPPQLLSHFSEQAKTLLNNRYNEVHKSPQKRLEMGLQPLTSDMTVELAQFKTDPADIEQYIRIGMCPETARDNEDLHIRTIRAVEKKHGFKLGPRGKLAHKDILAFHAVLVEVLDLMIVAADWYPANNGGSKPVLNSNGISVKASKQLGTRGMLGLICSTVGFGPSKSPETFDSSSPNMKTLRIALESHMVQTETNMTRAQLDSTAYQIGRIKGWLRGWSNAWNGLRYLTDAIDDDNGPTERPFRPALADRAHQRDFRDARDAHDVPRAPRDRSAPRGNLRQLQALDRHDLVAKHEELRTERYSTYEATDALNSDEEDEHRHEKAVLAEDGRPPFRYDVMDYGSGDYLVPLQPNDRIIEDRWSGERYGPSHGAGSNYRDDRDYRREDDHYYGSPRRQLANVMARPSGDVRGRFDNAPTHTRPPDRNMQQQDRHNDQRDRPRDQPRDRPREQGRYDNPSYPANASSQLVDPRARQKLSAEKAAVYKTKPCYGHMRGVCSFPPNTCPFSHDAATIRMEFDAFSKNMANAKPTSSPAVPTPPPPTRAGAPALRLLQQGQELDRGVHWGEFESQVAELNVQYHRDLAAMSRRDFDYDRGLASIQRRESEQQYAGRDQNQLILGYADGEIVGEYTGDSSGYSSAADS